ncbi:MAG TPA: DUF4349 domain-containing protein [Gemmatimonadaceae bacterium]
MPSAAVPGNRGIVGGTVMAAPTPMQRVSARADAASASDPGASSGMIDQALAGEPSAGADPSGTMLVRQGEASVEVKRLDDGVATLRQTAAQLGGFVANVALSSGKDERHTGTLQVRVPSAKFDALIAALSSLGRVESISSTVEDVGGEYVDLEAREANARHMEARLLEMLSQRTGKLSEVLSVEQELRRVREEIERYDARLKWLARRATLSSLDVTIHEPLPLIDRRPGPGPLAEAFAQAWQRAVAVVAFMIAALGILIPLGAVVAVGVVLTRRILRPGSPPGVSGV